MVDSSMTGEIWKSVNGGFVRYWQAHRNLSDPKLERSLSGQQLTKVGPEAEKLRSD
jgi:hypothetical protein